MRSTREFSSLQPIDLNSEEYSTAVCGKTIEDILKDILKITFYIVFISFYI